MGAQSKTFKDFRRCFFQPDGGARIEIPNARVEHVGGLRDHVHEYPHADGGAGEKQGNKLYEIRIDGLFYEIFKKFKSGLYPFALDTLVRAFEAGTSGILVTPSPIFGTRRAYCINWTHVTEAKILSGERVTLHFREDREDDFTADKLIDLTPASLEANLLRLQLEALKIVPKPGIFDAINDAVNAVLSIKDQVGLAGALLESRLQYVVDLCHQADDLFVMKDPSAARVFSALRDISDAALRFAADVQAKSVPLKEFMVPSLMTCTDLSRAIYQGDASHAQELLDINSGIDDELNIPAGLIVRYYPLLASLRGLP